jgi:hypothetical protein
MRTNVRHFAKNNPAVSVVPAKSLNFQLVQSEIEFAWGLVELGGGLRAEKRDREAAEALKRARNAVLKGERYRRDLKGLESVSASSNLQLLREVIGPTAVPPAREEGLHPIMKEKTAR